MAAGGTSAALESEFEALRPTSSGEEELQLQLALAMSKEEHEEEQRRLKGDEAKLQMAIDESRKQVLVPSPSPVRGDSGLRPSSRNVCLNCGVHDKTTQCFYRCTIEIIQISSSSCGRGIS